MLKHERRGLNNLSDPTKILIAPPPKGPVRERRIAAGALFLCLFLVTIPFLVVRYVPSTDLPQHLAQIRLLEDHFRNPAHSEYAVEWFGANSLVYGLIGANWVLFKPVLAGKMAVLELALAWVFVVFAFARRKECPVAAAVLASILVFNASLYWGFLNFLLAWPVFGLWYLTIVDRDNAPSKARRFLLVVLESFFLFFAHTLWLLIGILVLFATDVFRRRSFKQFLMDCFALVPVGIWSAIWYPRFAAIRSAFKFDMAARWFDLPWERLSPAWLVDAMLGGLRGPIEAVVFAIIILWIGMSLVTNIGKIRSRTEWDLFFVGGLFLLVASLAPDKYVNTMYFASRWTPIAVTFILLALPMPKMPSPLALTVALLLFVSVSSLTGVAWYRFETTENSGLEQSLDGISDGAKVVGLEFIKDSKMICGRPFLQTFAYAQVLHGGELNFSFAKHHSGIISYARIDTIYPGTPGLVWEPEKVRVRDFVQFDYALIHASGDLHRYFASYPLLKPLTTDGTWRLYRCGLKGPGTAQRTSDSTSHRMN